MSPRVKHPPQGQAPATSANSIRRGLASPLGHPHHRGAGGGAAGQRGEDRAGRYCHFPAGTAMHHAPADGESCLFVTIFHGAL
jgi:hypothetical protein